MSMNWFASLFYGFISGLAEFLPVSSAAHQQIFLHIFGSETRDPARDLFVHIAILASLCISCRGLIEQFRRDNDRISTRSRRTRQLSRNAYDVRLIKNAAVPMLVLSLILAFIMSGTPKLILVCLFLLINGFILFLPEHMTQGNKDARSMSYLDSLLMGICGAFSLLPGISRIAVTTSFAGIRGAERRNALTWALLLSIPALFLLCGIDLLSLIAQASNISFWSNFFSYFLSAIGAFAGGYFSVILVKLITANFGLSGFAYYSWGASLFSFIIYLTVV